MTPDSELNILSSDGLDSNRASKPVVVYENTVLPWGPFSGQRICEILDKHLWYFELLMESDIQIPSSLLTEWIRKRLEVKNTYEAETENVFYAYDRSLGISDLNRKAMR